MRTNASILAMTTIAAIAAASPASAASWTGCYVSGLAGLAATNTETSLTVGGAPVVSIDGLGSDGTAFGLGAGCDWEMSGPLVLGAFADYLWHDSTFEVTATGVGSVLSLDTESQWTIGGRLGYVPIDNAMIYALVGYTSLETSDIAVPIAAVTLPVDTMIGWTLGGGIETWLAPNISLGAEYRYTSFGTETVPVFGPLAVDLDPDMHVGLARLSYRFGGWQAAPLK